MKNSSEKSRFHFLESIAVVNGKAKLLQLHQQRVNRTFKTWFPKYEPHKLIIPNEEFRKDQLYKWRFRYNESKVSHSLEKYSRHKITSLEVVHSETINYEYKYSDRDQLYELLSHKQSENSEEIIITKNGFITDTTYHNLVLSKGRKLFTPRTPLLKGVQREHLIQSNLVTEKDIHYLDLLDYQYCYLVNALNPIENCNKVDCKDIIF